MHTLALLSIFHFLVPPLLSHKHWKFLCIKLYHWVIYSRHNIAWSYFTFSRHHCLRRWTFCDVLQVAEGPRRWERYFAARRKVEARMEQGRPGRDYRVTIQRFSRLASRIHREVSLIPTRSSAEVFNCRRFDYSVVVFFKAW